MHEWTLMVPRAGMDSIGVDLGHETVRQIALAIQDMMDNLTLQSALAFHPSAAVRAEVARRDFIDEAAVRHLLTDRDREVTRALIWSAAARRVIEQDWLTAACASDVQLAIDVAGNVAAFDRIEPSALVAHLLAHPDPGVRAAVARAHEAGRSALRTLAADADPEVRGTAQETLQT